MKSNTKLVVSLIKRVEVRLPINNTNRTIDLLEQDPITQQTVAAIIEISTHKLPDVINQLGLVLDSIPKVSFQGSTEVYIPLDVLQSQLFVIRLLSACLQHHWSWYKKHSIQISQETNRTEEARATGAYVNSSSNNSSTTLNVYEEADIYMDPPALDEKLTSFILNLMSRFIGQLHAIEERNEQFSSMTLDQLNDTSNIPLRLNSQSLEYVKDVYAAAGKVLYYISASNWSTFYTRIKSACSSPSTSSENSSIMSPDIRFLSFACLNVQKLQNILIDLSSFFISMKIQGKLLSAEMLRQAIWRWIQLKTTQFTDICTGKSNPLTGLEILFDICNVAADTSKKKAVLWPLQTLLLTLSPDFLSQAFFDSRGLQNRRTVFPRQLKKALDSPKTQEIAAICYIDLCKASTYISPQEDNVLHHIAEDIEGVLREKVWDFSRASAVESFPTSLGYTICHQTLLNDFFLSFLKINPTRTLDRFLPTLFEDDAPVLFKLAFVNACLQLTQDENRSSDWNPAIQSLYGTICAPLRRIFIHTVKHELSSGAAKSMVSTTASGSKKFTNASMTNSTISNSERKIFQQPSAIGLLIHLLKLFKSDPLIALSGGDNIERVDNNCSFMTSLIYLIRHEDKRFRRAAVDLLVTLNSPENIKHWGPESTLVNNFWKITSHTKLILARIILDSRQNEDLVKTLLDTLSKISYSRSKFLSSLKDIIFENIEVHERIQASVTLEISLLICLCSPVTDICSMAIKCLGYMCTEARLVDEETLVETSSRSSSSVIGFSYNIEVYEDMSYEEPLAQQAGKQTFIGRKAQQKRIRKFLRMILTPTTGIVTAWEEIWKRWRVLTPIVSQFGMDSLKDMNELSVVSSMTGPTVKKIGGLVRHEKLRSPSVRTMPVPVGRIETDDEKQTEWLNYIGFLAALGGAQLASETGDDDHDDRRQKMDESNRKVGSPTTRNTSLSEKFVAELTELLTSDNVMIREGAKDTLGAELSPSLYAILFRLLEQATNHCFNANGDVICDSRNNLFVEQTVLVLKMILDRLVDHTEYLLSIDFSGLINRLAIYINRLPRENYTTMRIMIAMCHLIELVILKKEQVVIRDDVRVRNKLVEILIEWTSDFSLSTNKGNRIQNNTQNKDVQRDLDQVCLRAIVSLLQKLPLQASEQNRDLDRGTVKNKLFKKYFSYFTQLLDRCHQNEAEMDGMGKPSFGVFNRNNRDLTYLNKSSESYQYWVNLKELSLTAISNLLSSNVDIGLKSTLAMGYHDDSRTRAAFIQVLSNILNQGAQFDTLAENMISDRYDQLVDLLVVESDVDFALTVCEVCSAVDAVSISQTLITCFESRHRILPFLKAIIEDEVFNTGQEATLFRGTTVATRILSMFARETCFDYLRLTLQPALEYINSLPDEKLTCELDPEKARPDEDLVVNKINVCRATEVLLSAICNSTENAPKMFRQELALIVEAVNKRFPDSSKTAVGGFVFLRLFNPAILTPESSGFSKAAMPRSKLVRKLLLQCTRMMQNLANNMMFSSKELHLIYLNDFITNNLYRVASFLRDISYSKEVNSEIPMADSKGVRVDDVVSMCLHRHLYENLEKISREYSLRRSKTHNDTQKLLGWKRTMEKFSDLLGQLGPPADMSNRELTMARNYALVSSNNYYSEFIRRNKHRDLSSINSMNIFYLSGVSKTGTKVFYLLMKNIVGENFDHELLVYYMLRVMEPHLNHPYEILVDFTRSTMSCEIPTHWMAQFFQLVFSELNDYLIALHLYNCNFHMQGYARRLPGVLTNKLVKRVKFHTSIAELSNYIALSEIGFPKDIYEVEKTAGMIINNGHVLNDANTLIPAKIKIGTEYLIVTTLKEQEIFWGLSTTLNNVFSMTDIYNVYLPAIPLSKKNSNNAEIHILYENGKSTLVLVVPNREEVYRYIMDKKKKFDSNLNESKQGIRPADVPGRLLNIALLSLGSEDPVLRGEAYGLLCSLCSSFRFGIENKLMNTKDLSIPANSASFIANVSESIASSEIHLTLEFLHECILGFNQSASEPSRQVTALEYIVPWLKNLSYFLLVPNASESSKVKDVIRSLILITADRKAEIYQHVQEKIWRTIKDIDELHSLVIEEITQYSVENGIGSPQAEAMADTINTMNSNAIRGKVINRLRRVLYKTSQNPRSSLINHQAWNEIGCLIRFILMLSFYQDSCSKPYVAEVFHIISMVVCSGPTFIRSSVHELLVNTIHLLVTDKYIQPENRMRLKYVLDDVCDGKYRIHFGLNKSYANAFTITEETMTDNMESMNLSSLEVLVRLMLDAGYHGACDTDMANSWHARWMSLVTSMTFQYNPALQPRAFVVLGCLAQDEIDDDLLYQILIVLRNELDKFDNKNPDLVVSILMCLVNVIDNISSNSRYVKPLFWLAISMIQINNAFIFPHAIKMLNSVVRVLDNHKCFDKEPMASVLMDSRAAFAKVCKDIDAASGFSFDTQFSFAIVCALFTGYRYSDSRESIFECINLFLQIEAKSTMQNQMIDARCLGYFCGLLIFSSKSETLIELLRLAGIDDITLDTVEDPSGIYGSVWKLIDIPNNTTGIILVSFLVSLLSLTENENERLFLYGFLSRAAVTTPEVFSLVYDSLIPKMNSVILSTENSSLINTVKGILVTACSESVFSSTEKLTNQKVILDRLGFKGLTQPTFGTVFVPATEFARLSSRLLRVLCE